MAKRSSALTKEEANIVSKGTPKAIRKHLRSIQGAALAASVPQSFDIKVEGGAVAAQPTLNDEQARGLLFGESLVKLAQTSDGNFADYVRQMVGKSSDFLTSVDGAIIKALRHEREAVDQQRDAELKVASEDGNLTPAAARASRRSIEDWARRRKASLANGRLVQTRKIIASLTTSRTDVKFDWKACHSFSDFYTEAQKLAAARGKTKFVPLTESGFKQWSGKMKRIVDVGNYEPDSEKSAAQLARLETMIQQAIASYLKVAEKIPTLAHKAEVLSKTLVEMIK